DEAGHVDGRSAPRVLPAGRAVRGAPWPGGVRLGRVHAIDPGDAHAAAGTEGRPRVTGISAARAPDSPFQEGSAGARSGIRPTGPDAARSGPVRRLVGG